MGRREATDFLRNHQRNEGNTESLEKFAALATSRPADRNSGYQNIRTGVAAARTAVVGKLSSSKATWPYRQQWHVI